MKKLLVIFVAVLLVFTVTACSGGKDDGKKSDKIAIAEVVSSAGSIDDRSFCQGTYEGIKKYADENNLTYGYYQSVDESVTEFINTIRLAISGGADIVVAPGFTWNAAIFEAQDLFPDTSFVIIDGEPVNEDYTEFRIEKNVYSVYFAEQQAGLSAGYAAVIEGYRDLGFIGGMAVPAVVRFGYGYVQGIEDAAQSLNLAKGDIKLRYHYLGNFDPSPENQTFASSWYSSGTECIFFCAGDVSNVGMAAAKQAGPEKVVIGVDVNQGWEDNCVITSAVKDLGTATYGALSDFYDGKFKGGEIVTLDAAKNGVGLPLDEETWRFKTFTRDMYDDLFERLSKNEIEIPDDVKFESVDQIPVSTLTVEVI